MKKKILILLAIALLLVGCTRGYLEWWIGDESPTETPGATETVLPTPTYTSTPTATESPTDAPSPTPTITPTPNPLVNLLVNPGFEGEYVTQDPLIPEVRVAPGWRAWWVEEDTGVSWEMNRPEFGDMEHFAYRIRSGAKSQKIHKMYSTWFSGVAQRVTVNPGDQVLARAWVQSWSSAYDDNDTSSETPPLSSGANPGQKSIMIGIDPLGGLDPLAPSVQWTAYTLFEFGTAGAYDGELGCGWDLMGKNPVYDYDSNDDDIADTPAYNCLQMTAYAEASAVTLFIGAEPAYPVKHNDLYIDDALLVVIGQGPIPTGAPPTPTPETAGFVVESLVNSLRIRSGPSTSKDILGYLYAGDQCTSSGDVESVNTPYRWLPVVCNSIEGWVYTGVQGGLYLTIVNNQVFGWIYLMQYDSLNTWVQSIKNTN